jgi:pimeloyl-ACP methyl ester carboxylesterase
MVSGLVLLFVCPLPKAQTSITPAMGGEYVDVGGSKIWYEECGPIAPGPTVVLLHDGLVHSITWDAVWAPLCSRYHVLRYDRRGYGRSEPAKTPFVPEDDLSKIMRRVHVDRAMIVGNSSGGGLALDFALAHPEMVEALFLIGPVVHGMPSSDYFNERGSQNSAPLAHGDVKGTAENWSRDRFLIAGDDQRARKKVDDVLTENPQNLRVPGELEIRLHRLPYCASARSRYLLLSWWARLTSATCLPILARLKLPCRWPRLKSGKIRAT